MTTTFSMTARSERHFTALLLSHLLMSNNFAGCRKLFDELGLSEGITLDPGQCDFEIVAELNPIRDVVARTDDSATLISGGQGQVVPDLFIRVDNHALVIEAKFFTHPSASAVAAQLKAQREAIEMALPYTKYPPCKIHYMALTVKELEDDADWGPDTSRMTWREIISLLEISDGSDESRSDTVYALQELKNAEERSRKEAIGSSNEKGRYNSIDELLEGASVLLDKGYLYVGFEGGHRALKKVTLDEMTQRHHYKYSDCKPNDNWLPLHSIISRYLELKAEVHRTDREEDCS